MHHIVSGDRVHRRRTVSRAMREALAAVTIVGVLAGCGGGGGGSTTVPPTSTTPLPSPQPQPTTNPQTVGVSGAAITLDGSAYLPRSVVIRGFVSSPTYLQSNEPNVYNGEVNFGPAELNAARAFGADTLRFLIGQPSLDPQSPLYSATFVSNLEAAIAQARAAGFVVLLAMQDESESGETTHHALATAETVANWDFLAARYGQDRGILFELYNEPSPTASTANWALWANGGPYDGYTTVGMQTMISHLRSENVQNVLVLDGLDLAKTLAGVPAIADPLNRVVYAVHPYFNGSPDETAWDANFGNASATVPVFADEWSAAPGTSLGLGNTPTYQASVDLLNYLRLHDIALGGGAFDVSGVMTQSVPGWVPTNYDDFSPSNTADQAGLLISNDFLADYKQPLAAASGVTP